MSTQGRLLYRALVLNASETWTVSSRNLDRVVIHYLAIMTGNFILFWKFSELLARCKVQCYSFQHTCSVSESDWKSGNMHRNLLTNDVWRMR